jgi:hypothetical protein
MVLPPPMQSSLPAGWLAFTGRESNPLDRALPLTMQAAGPKARHQLLVSSTHTKVWLVVLHGQKVVGLGIEDRLGDVGIASDGIDRDQGASEIEARPEWQ